MKLRLRFEYCELVRTTSCDLTQLFVWSTPLMSFEREAGRSESLVKMNGMIVVVVVVQLLLLLMVAYLSMLVHWKMNKKVLLQQRLSLIVLEVFWSDYFCDKTKLAVSSSSECLSGVVR